jgi:copper chaperone CopZ
MPTFRVPDMHCDGCVRAITAAVRAVAPAAAVQADLRRQQVRIGGAADVEALAQALRDAGFTAESCAP